MTIARDSEEPRAKSHSASGHTAAQHASLNSALMSNRCSAGSGDSARMARSVANGIVFILSCLPSLMPDYYRHRLRSAVHKGLWPARRAHTRDTGPEASRPRPEARRGRAPGGYAGCMRCTADLRRYAVDTAQLLSVTACDRAGESEGQSPAAGWLLSQPGPEGRQVGALGAVEVRRGCCAERGWWARWARWRCGAERWAAAGWTLGRGSAQQ